MNVPQTRYVTVGDSQVAYQVVGEGPLDVVVYYALGAQMDLFWQIPSGAELLRRIAEVRRLILFDRRGSGTSGPLPFNAVPTWEELAEDLTAVLDAAGSQRAAVIGAAETGPIAVLFSAMHPERVSQLVLINSAARYLEADDYPIGLSPTAVDALVDLLIASWGTDDLSRMTFPSLADDAESIAWVSRMMRASATPHNYGAQIKYSLRNVDVRRFLPLVQAPTAVFHAVDNQLIPLALGRYLADHIPGATLVETPGADILPLAPVAFADIVEFVTGERPALEVDRLLTTVLFTDIVGSTERAVALGDHGWRVLLDAHDRAVREQIRRFRGKEINTTGDGFLVSFDGPARAIRCAQAIGKAVEELGVEVRSGLHTGECEVRGDDLGGLAVHIAARIGAFATSQEILVSAILKDLVAGSGIEFIDRGEHELKGVPGSWKISAVQG